MVGPLRGGAGVKFPITTKQKKTFFLWFKMKLPEPFESKEKWMEKNLMICSVLVNIDQQKRYGSENIIFSNLNLTEMFC